MVTRYYADYTGEMIESATGAYVSFEDYERLRLGDAAYEVEQHYNSINYLVADYRRKCKTGSPFARNLRERIEATIAKHGLDPVRVWGIDPDDHS